MRNRLGVLFVLTLGALTSVAQADPLKLGGIGISPSSSGTILVDYSGTLPADASEYQSGSNWHVQWQQSSGGPVTTVGVVSVHADQQQHFVLKFSTAVALPEGDARRYYWNVVLTAPKTPFLQAMLYIPNNPIPAPPASGTTAAPVVAGKSCTSTYPNAPTLCPANPTDTPDLSFTGSFTAAGGSNPLYQFEIKGGYFFPVPDSWRIKPAINTQIEINQNPNPPVHRTKFDPDSITAGLAFTTLKNFDPAPRPVENATDAKLGRFANGPIVTGLRYQLQAPSFEFNRSDPSGNIIASAIAAVDFKPWQPKPKKDPKTGTNSYSNLYATMYPFVGLETGRNLYRPGIIEMIPVDLSRYKGIVRGYAGADAKFGVISPDRSTDVFSITGTYRVRVPALDEPFLETIHQVTSFSMTTKDRHWVESDVSYSPQSWKYFSLTATYQYGTLPPFFELVDHKFTFGIKLQVVQGTKPADTKLVQ